MSVGYWERFAVGAGVGKAKNGSITEVIRNKEVAFIILFLIICSRIFLIVNDRSFIVT